MATTTETPRFRVYQNLLVQCLILWLAIVLLFGAERLLMFYYFVPENIRNQPQLEITALFIKGLLLNTFCDDITTRPRILEVKPSSNSINIEYFSC